MSRTHKKHNLESCTKLFALPAVLIIIMGVNALSLPRLSAEHGIPCKSCHINPNGGGARTEFGNYAVAFQELCLPQTKKYVEKHYKSPRLSESVYIGFDNRYLVLDEGGRIIRIQNDFYATVEPFDHLLYHLRIAGGGITEHYALLYIGDDKHYLKAGQFSPAFGLRTDYHSLYLDGLSLGLDIKGVNVVAETFNPNEQAIFGFHAFKAGFLNPFGYLIGASARVSERELDGYGAFPHAKAVFGALNYSRFTASGELKLIGRGNEAMAAYAAFNARIEFGLYLVGEYNFYDPDRAFTTGTEEFIRLSLELYPIPFLQLRPSFTRYMEGALKDTDDFFLQIYFGY